MSERLDAIAFPLWGSRLIEASAGTGKTWTIAALYVRLVLGHGTDETRFGATLDPSRILVMTFTIAATRELSKRVRDRLLDAARFFRGGAGIEPDPFLESLVADHPDVASREHAAWRLAAAADAMDDATVLTIDAWVQKVLREHAFDSGSPLDETLEPDQDAMLVEAARDYWRREVYPLTGVAFERVGTQWSDIDALTNDVRKLMWKLDDEGDDDADADVSLGAILERARAAAGLDAIKAGWAERFVAMRAWLLDETGSGKRFSGKFLKRKTIESRLDKLIAWARDPEAVDTGLEPDDLARFTPACLETCLNAGRALDAPPVIDAYQTLLDALANVARLDVGTSAAMRLHAARAVRQRVRALKERAGIFGFQDQIVRLDRALGGPGGDALRRRLVEQSPVALIDEFQDTSPLQYRIFDRIYRTADNDRSTAMLLIGDPKQSIYGFRGADIHSYLEARAATAGRHYRLTTNYRSTVELVAAVNHLFGEAEARGDGAFRFGRDGTGPLPFVPVDAHGCRETLVTATGPLPAVTISHDATSSTKPEMLQRLGDRCAEFVATMLIDPQAGFETGDGRVRALQPSDIAILVRTHDEAAAIRTALDRRNVASTFLSETQSVFASDEAVDLTLWLAAMAEPYDARRARAAFATRLVGLPTAELAALARGDASFDRRVEALVQLNTIWREQGVLATIHRMLHGFDLPATWLRQARGERRLTNVLHLAELLQAASTRLDGEQALIRWFVEKRTFIAKEVDAEVVRLESDDALIRVVTVHKAKGLQYRVVCLPFACTFREGDDDVAWLPDGTGRRRLSLTLDADARTALTRERKQEDLRLLYVALTRAEHALWLGVAPPRNGTEPACAFHRSAFGYLLVDDVAVDDAGIAGALHARFDGLDAVTLIAADAETPLTRLAPRVAPRPLVDAPDYAATFERDWTIGSFSSLVRDLARLPFVPVAIDPAVEEEILGGPLDEDADGARPVAPAASAPRHRFPRGAAAGNFLHDQLEWLAGRRFALGDRDVEDELVRRCERQGWGHRSADVVTWLREVVSTPLPPLGLPLDGLSRILPEMEFWFPAERIDARAIDGLCATHLLNGRERPPLPVRRLHGMLMGFTDLVFEHGGRYWILDYKSNALGERDDDYTRDAIERAMADHRYDVQGAIYLLALHRLLRARLRDRYDPLRHLGGALVFFLRGIRGPEAGCYVLASSPALLDGLDAAFANEPLTA